MLVNTWSINTYIQSDNYRGHFTIKNNRALYKTEWKKKDVPMRNRVDVNVGTQTLEASISAHAWNTSTQHLSHHNSAMSCRPNWPWIRMAFTPAWFLCPLGNASLTCYHMISPHGRFPCCNSEITPDLERPVKTKQKNWPCWGDLSAVTQPRHNEDRDPLAGVIIKWTWDQQEKITKFNTCVCIGTPHAWRNLTPHMQQRFRDRQETSMYKPSGARDGVRCLGHKHIW